MCCFCVQLYNGEKMIVSLWVPVLALDVDKESSGSEQKLCPDSIFSMSAGVGRGSLKCEDDRSLLSQRLWSDILMCLCLNHTPTQSQPETSDIPTWRNFDSWHLVNTHSGLLLIFFLTYIILYHYCFGIPYFYSLLKIVYLDGIWGIWHLCFIIFGCIW